MNTTKQRNYTLHVTPDMQSVQILLNGQIYRSIHIYGDFELESKKAWMSKKIEEFKKQDQQ